MFQYFAYGIYFVIIGIFITIAVMGIYHMRRFGADWKRTRFITLIFVTISSILLISSLYFMVRIPWSKLL